MVIWGVNLAALIASISRLLKSKFNWSDDSVVYLAAAMTFMCTLFVMNIDALIALCPPLGVFGPQVLTAFVAALGVLGFGPDAINILRAKAQVK